MLLSLGASAYRGARKAAHAAVAENNLRQVSVALELYFGRYLSYPRQGTDLVAALAPFVSNPRVFDNPLVDEAFLGESINAAYQAPSLREIDRPNCPITAFRSDDGATAVCLKTGGIVERHDGQKRPDDVLSQSSTPLDVQWPARTGAPALGQFGGTINLNPTNDGTSGFALRKPDGTLLTRDDLVASGGGFDYSGPATWVRFTPKGAGDQNGLLLDGQLYPLKNGTTYVIQGGTISVHLYNGSGGTGKAMGNWWLAPATHGATIGVAK